MKSARELISAKEAARILGLSIWTIRSWAYAGKIASHKVGARLMFDRNEIDRVINETERPRLEKRSDQSEYSDS